MGLMDNIREIFSSSKSNSSTEQIEQRDEEYEKAKLVERIENLVDRIKRINSFDSSIWNLSNISSYQLKRRSLEELTKLNFSLEKRLSELNRQAEKKNPERELLEQSKWTGQKMKNMSDYEFDRFQRDEGR